MIVREVNSVELDGSDNESDEGTVEESQDKAGYKGTKIFKISREIEDLNYHLASVFPSFMSTNATLQASRMRPEVVGSK